MKKANLACAHLPVARVLGKFGSINLTRLQAKFDENLKFESKFCSADGFLKFNPNLSNLLKFDEAPSKFNQSVNPRPTKSSKMCVGKFCAGFSATPSNFKLRNQKERKNK
nr:hypothetical protein [uncultured Campylobacter sp.]